MTRNLTGKVFYYTPPRRFLNIYFSRLARGTVVRRARVGDGRFSIPFVGHGILALPTPRFNRRSAATGVKRQVVGIMRLNSLGGLPVKSYFCP